MKTISPKEANHEMMLYMKKLQDMGKVNLLTDDFEIILPLENNQVIRGVFEMGKDGYKHLTCEAVKPSFLMDKLENTVFERYQD